MKAFKQFHYLNRKVPAKRTTFCSNTGLAVLYKNLPTSYT